MQFVKHPELADRHSLLSPSKSAWLRYNDDKLERFFAEHLKAARGTKEYAFAANAIELGIRMPDEPKTLNMYVNDCIGWRMKPEVALKWSDIAFGTADAVGFTESKMTLRISDLKTGKTATTFDQLIVYAGLFCLEYEYPRPWDLNIELRIYQGNAVKFMDPDPDDVFRAMDRMITGTRLFEQMLTN